MKISKTTTIISWKALTEKINELILKTLMDNS